MRVEMKDQDGSVIGVFPAEIRMLTPDRPSCDAYGTGEEPDTPACVGPAYVWEDEYGLDYDMCCVHSLGIFRVL